MEVSVSFTDKAESEYEEKYHKDKSVLGNVYIPKEGVTITGPIAVRYEKHPWIEQFEIDGIRAVVPKRQGFGVKNAQGFVQSLSTIYSEAYDIYHEYIKEGELDAHAYFGYATDYFMNVFEDERRHKMVAKFCGFVENMWREGDEAIYNVAMQTVLEKLRNNQDFWDFFENSITQEFKEYIESYNEKNNLNID